MSRSWSSALIPELILELIFSYHRPMKHELERLGILIRHCDACHRALALRTLQLEFSRFAREETIHLLYEETVVFPLCLQLEEHLHSGRNMDLTGATSAMRQMADGHADSQQSSAQLVTLAGKAAATCTPSDPDLDLVRAGLEALAARLLEHREMEEDILLPAAIAAEEQLQARSSSGRYPSMP
jgi:iron-sulfur cluster repair protein YtfE (RIC family)